MTTGAIRAGRAFIELFLDKGPLMRGLRSTQDLLRNWAGSVAMAGGLLTGTAAALIAPLVAAVTIVARSGDQLVKLSERTGIAVDALSELQYAARRSDVEVTELQQALVTLNNKMGEALAAQKPGDAAVQAFAQIGISVRQLRSMSPEALLTAIAHRIKMIESPALRTKLALDLFGKSGAAMLPLLLQGSEGIERLRQRARELGLVWNEFDAKQAAQLSENLSDLWLVLGGIQRSIASALIPAINQLFQTFMPVVAGVSTWVSENKQLVWIIVGVAAALAIAGAALTAFSLFLIFCSATVTAVIALFAALKAAVLAVAAMIIAPLVLLTRVLSSFFMYLMFITGEWEDALGWIGESWNTLVEIAGDAVAGIRDALVAGRWDLAGKVVMEGLHLAIVIGWEAIQGIWRSAVNTIAKMLLAAGTTLEIAWKNFLMNMKFIAQDVWHEIEKVWTKGVNFIARKLMDIRSAQQTAANIDEHQAAREAILEDHKSGRITEEEATQKLRDLLLKTRNRQREIVDESNNLDEDNKAREEELKANQAMDRTALAMQRSKLNEENEKRQAELEDQLAGLDMADDEAEQNARDRINAARAEFDAAVEESEEARKLADFKRQQRAGFSFDRDLPFDFNSTKNEAVGTFFSGIAALLGPTSADNSQKQLDALLAIKANTKKFAQPVVGP